MTEKNKKLGREKLIQSYLIAMSAIRLASGHLISIQNEIGQFEYSKPVNIAHKDLDDVWQKLDKNLEAWMGKKRIDIDRKYTVKVELVQQSVEKP